MRAMVKGFPRGARGTSIDWARSTSFGANRLDQSDSKLRFIPPTVRTCCTNLRRELRRTGSRRRQTHVGSLESDGDGAGCFQAGNQRSSRLASTLTYLAQSTYFVE